MLKPSHTIYTWSPHPLTNWNTPSKKFVGALDWYINVYKWMSTFIFDWLIFGARKSWRRCFSLETSRKIPSRLVAHARCACNSNAGAIAQVQQLLQGKPSSYTTEKRSHWRFSWKKIPMFQQGNTSTHSFMVDFPACHLSFREGVYLIRVKLTSLIGVRKKPSETHLFSAI